MSRRIEGARLRHAVALVAAGCLTACSIFELPNLETDGFLADYERLEAHPEAGPGLCYVNPDVRLDAYQAVLLEPVQIWRSPGTRGLSVPDAQRLASRLYALIYARLSSDFRMVNYPVPNSLRIGVALTSAGRSKPYLYAVSTVSPRTLPVAEVRALESGTPAGMGEARIEARARDAVSGEVLMEGVAPPVRGDDPRRIVGSWSEVDHSFAAFADQLKALLCRERGGCSEAVR